ncbi:MAG: carboxypeptidase-like regulatory domain-containing protein, partial [Bacteroidaceae bacterium]|nr:carboxypeptidase-like regulatory domain-containing protein [Bacteroidaceae bacterium]
MKRIFLIYMIMCCSLSVGAQNITCTFKNQSLSKVLTTLRDGQNEYAIHFIHNDLEHLPVTASLKDLSVPEAVERICKGLPVRVKVKGADIFVQYKDKSKVRTMLLQGKVFDSRTHNELPGAMVYLLAKDSTVLDSCRAHVFFQSDDKTWYSSDFQFNIPKTQKTYIFKARMGGYETGYMEYTISNLHRREFNRQLPPLYLLEVGRMLKEVTVTASQVVFYHRGDTVVYNASAFQLAEGSMLDALVKQLPGVKLDSDGRIYHNGKFVESILLNGKEFFKGDNRVMLDNLPAYTVKQIEFYDKYGEKSEFLGQQLEADKGYVMDVKLKKEYSIGYLANVEAGGGPSFGEVHGDDAPKADERYLARLFAMRFTDHSRVAIFANANNLNDETRPGEDNNWNQRQSGKTGRATQQQGGIDYNVDARNKKWNVQGNTRFAHAKRDLQTTTHRTNFLPSGDTYERSRSMADDRSF